MINHMMESALLAEAMVDKLEEQGQLEITQPKRKGSKVIADENYRTDNRAQRRAREKNQRKKKHRVLNSH